jgi:hypothetical protein
MNSPSQPSDVTDQAAGEKKEKQGSKISDKQKLEKQLCNCYSLGKITNLSHGWKTVFIWSSQSMSIGL